MRQVPALIALVAALLLAGCGGGSTPPPPPPPPISVSVFPANASVAAQRTQLFTAVVSNTSNQSVTWKVNDVAGGNATIGTISAGGIYTAPDLVPNPATVTVTATSKADSSKSGSAAATVTVGISVVPAFTEVLLAGMQTFTAQVTGSPNTAVTWRLDCTSGCDLTRIGTITEIAPGIVQYTAPNAIPDNVLTSSDPDLRQLQPAARPISIVAAWQQDPTQTATASVFVNAGGPNINRTGQSTPVALGTSGGNATDMTGNFCCSGTLGALVDRNGTKFVLSNNHVLAKRDQAKTGDDISQQGLVDSNCSPATRVADFSQFVKLRNPNGCVNNCSAPADAAMAQIVSGQVDTSGAILQIGTVTDGLASPAPPANSVVTATAAMPVAKSGRTSGLSCSTVSEILVDGVQVEYETGCNGGTRFFVTYNDQIVIRSTSFGAPGDSGSLIVNAETAQPVGLLYAGSDTDTIANPIGTVLINLKDSKGVAPTMVGGAQHPVEACVGPPPPGPIGISESRKKIEDAELQRAIATKEAHVKDLLSIPAVLGVGVGAGDTPGEAAIVVFVEKGRKAGAIPTEVEGVKTRIRETNRFRAFTPKLACPPDKNDLAFPLSSGRRFHELGLGDLSTAGDGEPRLQSRQHAPCVKE